MWDLFAIVLAIVAIALRRHGDLAAGAAWRTFLFR
jgi:hypothetical protein